jgi:CRISPR-associated protein Cmr3
MTETKTSKEYYLFIEPLLSLIARDGRPFGPNGNDRMHSLDWFYPSTLAGAVRTLLGKLAEQSGWMKDPFSKSGIIKLKSLSIVGPFPCADGQIFFPVPKDAHFYREKDGKPGIARRVPVRPGAGEGCNLPHEQLWPAELVGDVPHKSDHPAPAFWSFARMVKWLELETFGEEREMPAFPKETRVHVKISSQSYTAEEGQLFFTTGLAFPLGTGIAARVSTDDDGFAKMLSHFNALHPFGGERRLAHFSTDHGQRWDFSESLIRKFETCSGLRMILASPAIFHEGWKPAWLNDQLEGAPPGVNHLRLKLRGVCMNPWKAISGWDYHTGLQKPVRRMVPAGSVYFFEVMEGNVADCLQELWLCSVCDDPQDRLDGFGSALWGIWNPETV